MILLDEYIVVKYKKDSEICFIVFNKNNLPDLKQLNSHLKSNWGNVDFLKKSIARAFVYDNLNLSKLGYRKFRNVKNKLDLNEPVLHLNGITVDDKYTGKGLGEKIIKLIIQNFNTDFIYLQPTASSINYWIHVGCEDTGYNYLDYEDTPLLKYKITR
jgi:hypothetical protein